MEVLPGIHRIDTDVAGRIACVFLVIGKQSAILIDAGMNYAPKTNILPYLEAVNCPRESIRSVIITHCDFDHTGGGQALRSALPNAQFLCHPAEKTESQSLEMLIEHRLGEFGRDHGIPDTEETKTWLRQNVSPTAIDGVLCGGEKIDLGGLVVDVLVLPGHSAGHLAFHITDQNVAIIADAVLGSSLLYRDGTPAFPPTYRYPGQYANSIDRLEALAPDILLTSHFDVMDKAAAQAFVVESRDFMNRLDLAVSEILSDGTVKSLSEISEVLAPKFGRWEPDAGLLICWPILGHLERMVAEGKVVCLRDDGVCRYKKLEMAA